MIEIIKLKDCTNANRFGTCTSCGKTLEEDKEIVRIRFSNDNAGTSICLCTECGANMRISLNDYEMEKLWEDFEDVPLNADECLDVDWLDFKKGTHREDIWLWFDSNHSKGVAWLMYEYEG